MLVSLSRQLRLKGHDVRVVVLRTTPESRRHHTALSAANIPILDLNKRTSRSPSAMLRLRHVLRDFRPDIVHTHRYGLHYSLPSILLDGLRGSPTAYVHTVHNTPTTEIRNRPVVSRLGYLLALRSGVIPVCLGESHRDAFAARYSIDAATVSVIPNGIDIAAHRQPARESSSGSVLQVAAVGRLTHQKNFEMLIRAVGLLPRRVRAQINVCIFGDGPERKRLSLAILSNGVQDTVSLCGHQPDVADLLRAFDVLVMTSKHEGLPLVLLEAGAASVAPLVPDLLELSSLVRAADLPTFDSGSTRDLAYELGSICMDTPRRVSIARRWSEVVRGQYSAEAMASQYEQLFTELLTARQD